MRHRAKRVKQTVSIFDRQLQAAYQPPDREEMVLEIKRLLDLHGLVASDELIAELMAKSLVEATEGLDETSEDYKEAVKSLKDALLAGMYKSNWMDDRWVQQKVEREGKEPLPVSHRRRRRT